MVDSLVTILAKSLPAFLEAISILATPSLRRAIPSSAGDPDLLLEGDMAALARKGFVLSDQSGCKGWVNDINIHIASIRSRTLLQRGRHVLF